MKGIVLLSIIILALFSMNTFAQGSIPATKYKTTTDKYFYYQDSLGNAKDTAAYDSHHFWYKEYLEVTNLNLTADTVKVEMWNRTKKDWTTNGFGLINTKTGDRETNVSEVIIPASTTYKYEVEHLRPGPIRASTLSSKTRAKKLFIGIHFVN